jgi:hypothetical protein
MEEEEEEEDDDDDDDDGYNDATQYSRDWRGNHRTNWWEIPFK